MSFHHPVSYLKCLADETRIRIMLLISGEGELCVCDLMAALDEGQSKISRHLAQLRNCGLLEDRRQGQWVYYQLASGLPAWVAGLLTQLNTEYADWLQADNQRLAQVRDLSVSGRPISCA